MRIRANIQNGSFSLLKDGNCPLLNSGLCDIITELGEDSLCSICTNHPRFRNFYEDFTEAGLGICCIDLNEFSLPRILTVCNSLERLDARWTDCLLALSAFDFDTTGFSKAEYQIPLEQLMCYFIFRRFGRCGDYYGAVVFVLFGVIAICAL